jgi:hypothetical protein
MPILASSGLLAGRLMPVNPESLVDDSFRLGGNC